MSTRVWIDVLLIVLAAAYLGAEVWALFFRRKL